MPATPPPTIVLSSEGELLAEASFSFPAGEASAGPVLLARGPERLVDYYFGSGGRHVIVRDAHGREWPGRIVATRWQPEGRLWYLTAA